MLSMFELGIVLFLQTMIPLFIALGAVKFDHWLSNRENRRNLIHSLLTEVKANKEYLKKKYVALYDDAYCMAKNSGNLRQLPLDTQRLLSALYLLIRNRNEWINRWSLTMGLIDWDHFNIRTENGSIEFPKWLDTTRNELLKALQRAEEMLEKLD